MVCPYSYLHLLELDRRESVLQKANVVDMCRRGEEAVDHRLVVVEVGRRPFSVEGDHRLVAEVESGCDLEVRDMYLLLCRNRHSRCAVGAI